MKLKSLTSTTGQSDIYDINYVGDVDDYIRNTASIRNATATGSFPKRAYRPDGIRSDGKGIVITKGKKHISRRP